jgi:hypothetical protein
MSCVYRVVVWQSICIYTPAGYQPADGPTVLSLSNLEVSKVIEVTRKRVIATLLLSIMILGQAFGGVSARAQRRHDHDQKRDQKRANGALIGNTVGLNGGRRRGLSHRRVLTIPTTRRLPRTPIMRRAPIIPVTSLRNRRHYRSQ